MQKWGKEQYVLRTPSYLQGAQCYQEVENAWEFHKDIERS